MNFDLQKALEQIKNNKDFLKLKKVIENNAYHDHESVFDHLVKTHATAEKEIKADFITNKNTKEVFEEYINEEIAGIKKRDLMQIFALIHDIGKVIVFENNQSMVKVNEDGNTVATGHEYWGSLIVGEITKEVELPEDALNYLSKCVRLHGVFNNTWQANKTLNPEELMRLLKLSSENIHIEQVFNGYVDCFSAIPFQPAIPTIHAILNNPDAYKPMKHTIIG